MTVNRVDFSTRKPLKMLPVGLMVEVVAVSAPACGGSKAGATPAAPVVKAKADNITMIGKIDADKGPVGAFTSKQHWPAMARQRPHLHDRGTGDQRTADEGSHWRSLDHGVHLQGRQGRQLLLELHDPCGGGANGMTGSMATKGWMKGNVSTT